jgi:hypothetical protein
VAGPLTKWESLSPVPVVDASSATVADPVMRDAFAEVDARRGDGVMIPRSEGSPAAFPEQTEKREGGARVGRV